ncbi:MAG: epoxide hydrolase family protein [Candidatus Nanopelagicales bacterium]|nr:epoxide hydrolase [Candidatus Nanopelagicales bacterium]
MPSPLASPFTIDVADAALKDLTDRLGRTRFTRQTAPGWRAGTDPDYLRELVAYWRTGFDWRARECQLNQVSQYTVTLEGQRVHFVHVRAVPSRRGSASLPLVLTHGWPSSFVEMLPLIAPLTNPAAHGGKESDAFDVVIPSLPGFAFSDLPRQGPVIPPMIADLWARLMSEVLGYPRFGAYGGDIGSHVTGFLGSRHPERVVGIYTHHPNLHPILDDVDSLTAAEQAYLAGRSNEQSDDGYAAMQSTRPDTLAAALLDSPAGLAAWLVEKYRTWGDCEGNVETRFSKDTLLTIISLYWFTGTIGSSFRPYFDDHQTPPLAAVEVPTGVTLTPEDRDYPREYAERTYRDLRQWRGPSRGGHFLPLEEPALLANDLRDFFRPLRPTSASGATKRWNAP